MRSETIRATSREKEKSLLVKERKKESRLFVSSISVSATVFKLITIVSPDNVNKKLITNLKESSNTVFKHLKLRILTQILLKKTLQPNRP